MLGLVTSSSRYHGVSSGSQSDSISIPPTPPSRPVGPHTTTESFVADRPAPPHTHTYMHTHTHNVAKSVTFQTLLVFSDKSRPLFKPSGGKWEIYTNLFIYSHSCCSEKSQSAAAQHLSPPLLSEAGVRASYLVRGMQCLWNFLATTCRVIENIAAAADN